jgi:hypothetical protein
MIDPQWDVVDLDPVTWRNLGRFINVSQYVRAAQPGEHGLFIVHDGGRVLKIFDTNRHARSSVKINRVVDARALAQELYAHGQWDRVHIIDRQHLARVGRVAGASANRALHLDGYYHLVYDLIWDSSGGYVCEPPKPAHWHHWTMSQLEQFVSRLPPAASLALGVFEGAQLNIGLVLAFERGRIVRVTTFEAPALQPLEPRLSPDFLDQLWAQLAHIAPPAAALLCTQTAFDAWIMAGDKLAALRQALHDGAACVRLHEQLEPDLAAIA